MVLYLFDLVMDEECQRTGELSRSHSKVLLPHIKEVILVRAVMILRVIGGHTVIEGPLTEDGTTVGVEGHQIGGTIRVEDILEEVENPPMMEDP